MNEHKAFAVLADWARTHVAVNGFMARCVVNNDVPPGQIVYHDHEVHMSMPVFVGLHRWADLQERFSW